ncbi:response regulator transcription factor [Paraburkholderia sp. CI2]|uniref:response regulator n=1 Tax=Paraburkholderia sp. CI2 TaxID=2723093 RepID=UPI003907FB87
MHLESQLRRDGAKNCLSDRSRGSKVQGIINIIVADDHPVVLSGVRMVLSGHTDLRMVATACDSTEVVERLARVPCNVLVTDDAMPGGEYGDGVPYLAFLRKCFPDLKIIVFSMNGDPDLRRSLARIGVHSLILKSADVGELVSAIRSAFSGNLCNFS